MRDKNLRKNLTRGWIRMRPFCFSFCRLSALCFDRQTRHRHRSTPTPPGLHRQQTPTLVAGAALEQLLLVPILLMVCRFVHPLFLPCEVSAVRSAQCEVRNLRPSITGFSINVWVSRLIRVRIMGSSRCGQGPTIALSAHYAGLGRQWSFHH